jgi:uncharacterized protein YodC (DUF2158 family)
MNDNDIDSNKPDERTREGTKAPFSPGDNVKLKAGGPIMTVEKVRGDMVTCVWFDAKKVRSRKFLAAMLVGPDEVGDLLAAIKKPGGGASPGSAV